MVLLRYGSSIAPSPHTWSTNETLREDVTTVHGLDTGEILDSGNPAAAALKRFIYSQIEARRRDLPEADHPFIASAPRKWRTMS